MRTGKKFHNEYRKLEVRMKALVEDEGRVFLPNPEPEGPVNYVLICMEPSLGRWCRSCSKQARSKIKAGFRNFLPSDETAILHFSIRRYLCGSAQRYHITDLSKGAMIGKHADTDRHERYKRWYPLLQEEMDLVADPDARFVAIGEKVYKFLKRQGCRTHFEPVMHYSGITGHTRNKRIVGHEDDFKAFRDSVSKEDVVATAQDVLTSAHVPAKIRDDTLSLLNNFQLTTSRLQLMFIYKVAFEAMRGRRGLAENAL